MPKQRKMCPWRKPKCGLCENCEMDRYSDIWNNLDDEGREWLREQEAFQLELAGKKVPEKGTMAWEFLAQPSMTRWILR